MVHNYNPVKFEKNCFLVRQLQEAYEEATGLDGTPVTTTGGTYAKIMPNIVPFGPSFPGQKGIGHNPNEWMNIDDIVLNTKIYALSFIKLAGKQSIMQAGTHIYNLMTAWLIFYKQERESEMALYMIFITAVSLKCEVVDII